MARVAAAIGEGLKTFGTVMMSEELEKAKRSIELKRLAIEQGELERKKAQDKTAWDMFQETQQENRAERGDRNLNFRLGLSHQSGERKAGEQFTMNRDARLAFYEGQRDLRTYAQQVALEELRGRIGIDGMKAMNATQYGYWLMQFEKENSPTSAKYKRMIELADHSAQIENAHRVLGGLTLGMATTHAEQLYDTEKVLWADWKEKKSPENFKMWEAAKQARLNFIRDVRTGLGSKDYGAALKALENDAFIVPGLDDKDRSEQAKRGLDLIYNPSGHGAFDIPYPVSNPLTYPGAP